MKHLTLALAAALCSMGCIAPSVVDPGDRAPRDSYEDVEFAAATAEDLPGTYVSESLTGPVAAVLRMVVYCFGPDGSYTGAGLIDDAPPRFQVISGSWRIDGGSLVLDDAPPAELGVAADGSLRIAGPDGVVVLRREVSR